MSAKPEKAPATETPESAEAREKVRSDDAAVIDSTTVDGVASGTRSVLPGPPIPPEVQSELRKKAQTRTND